MEPNRKYPLIIAHRGSSIDSPENTISAFSRALECGTEGIEFDVRVSKDGVPFVFHDSGLKRINGNDTKISSLTASQIQEIDAGSWFNKENPDYSNPGFIGERIPTLESVLELLEGFAGAVYVELKSNGRNLPVLAESVGTVLNNYSGKLDLIVKCFNFEAVKLVKGICPEIQPAALFAQSIMLIMRKESRLIEIAKDLGANRLSLDYSLATESLMEQAKKNNLAVTIWTADSRSWIERSVSLGIDSVITNDPAAQLANRDLVLASLN